MPIRKKKQFNRKSVWAQVCCRTQGGYALMITKCFTVPRFVRKNFASGAKQLAKEPDLYNNDPDRQILYTVGIRVKRPWTDGYGRPRVDWVYPKPDVDKIGAFMSYPNPKAVPRWWIIGSDAASDGVLEPEGPYDDLKVVMAVLRFEMATQGHN